jgi:hypothetical protein
VDLYSHQNAIHNYEHRAAIDFASFVPLMQAFYMDILNLQGAEKIRQTDKKNIIMMFIFYC